MILVLKRVLDYSKHLAKQVIKPGDVVIDCTCGNGHDTLFLAELVGKTGYVYGFDVQEIALERTEERLNSANVFQAELILDGHEHVDQYIKPQHRGKIRCAMFNLGYLPNSDKQVTTSGETTIKAIKALLPLLAQNGLIILVVYSGHDEGQKEKDQLLQYLQTLDQKYAHVLKYQFVNQQNHAPFVLAIEKMKD